MPLILMEPYVSINTRKAERTRGAKLILWTCRCGADLSAALEWCTERGLIFDAVNENLPEHTAKYNNDCRKVYADRYIDDRNILIDFSDSYIHLEKVE